jgi:DNA-binding response OmpR family regulator
MLPCNLPMVNLFKRCQEDEMIFTNNKDKVLLIDDDASLRRQLRVHLDKHRNFEVIEASNCETGLAQAKSEKPNLIVLDWMMPDTQGDEVLTRLKHDSTTRDIPVIMLTGKNKIGEIEDAFDLGADSYLTKPFEVKKLGDKASEMLGG